jgi:hypothetical protein
MSHTATAGALRFFAGQGGGTPKILEVFHGPDDDGAGFDLFALSSPVSPQGPSGECLFTALFLSLTWSVDITLRLTPVVDGVAWDGTAGTTDERVTLALVGTGTRQTATYELPLTRALMDPIDTSHELARFYQRGRFFQLRLESLGADPGGDVILEQPWLEYEEVAETMEPVP